MARSKRVDVSELSPLDALAMVRAALEAEKTRLAKKYERRIADVQVAVKVARDEARRSARTSQAPGVKKAGAKSAKKSRGADARK
jgi:hypothetical protein